jgi:acyl-CoA synthetase (AMP-forming)/AMP-acid ligase II
MDGTMMDYPLTLTHILERAGRFFPEQEIVSRLPNRRLHRYSYADFYRRAKLLAKALQKAGLQRGERVATLMWNHYAHLECYFGVPVAGGVTHTLNLRLCGEDLGYIAKHAEARFLVVDDILLPVYETFRQSVQFERVWVVPHCDTNIPAGCESYEEFLSSVSGGFCCPDLKETEAAAMCYTSGTTGFPKGVVYTHRSLVLHSLMVMTGSCGLSTRDAILPIVPMFHANAWGYPYAATMAGCKQVFPGPALDAESLLDLCSQEEVTVAAGVPTVWFGIVEALERHPRRWTLQPMRTLVGGSAAPEALIRKLDKFGINLVQGWGMTESSPVATTSELKRQMIGLRSDEKYAIKARAGLAVPFVDLRICNESGEVPTDDETMGEIQLRGPWIASSYYKLPEEKTKWTADGWFRTGDVGTMNGNGYIKIVDRTKDLIKSGGEWISSVDLENAIVGHPDVREAAVIAVPHPKWQERPLAVVVLKEGSKVSCSELQSFLCGRFAKWQIPEAFAFVDQLPHTTTGKLLKSELRKRYRDWQWQASTGSV